MLATRSPEALPEGVAGKAYTESEDGQLQLNTGERTAVRTKVSGQAANDGSDEDWLTKFVLTERSGQKISSEQLKGQPYVAGFFFSTCPSICVRQNSKVQELQQKFKGRDIRFVSISCDPEVDSPEVLSDYAQRFGADKDQWLFFTGKMDYITRVGGEVFQLGVMRRGHPEKFALMDANGDLFGLYTWSDQAQWEALQQDIERLLAAGGVIDPEDS
jgi:protein SCO1/2